MKRLLVFTFLSFFVFSLHAETPSLFAEQKLLYKCYAHLTGLPPSPSLFKESGVLDGKVSALNYCKNLLMHTTLDQTKVTNAKKDTVSLAILNNFHAQFTNWFLFKKILPISNSYSGIMLKNFLDPADPALYWTFATFDKSANLDFVLNSKKYLRALRGDDPKNTPSTSPADCNLSNCSPLWTAKGHLSKIEAVDTMELSYRHKQKQFLIPIFQHFGGGIIGNSTYIYESIFESYSFQSDGTVNVPRIWATAVFNDLLCRNLPLIKKHDLPDNLFSQDSPVAFRRNKECLVCHASVDQASLALRNFRFVQSPNDTSASLKEALNFQAPFASEMVSPSIDIKIDWPLKEDPQHYLTSPQAILFFRNFENRLINIKAKNLESLAEQIRKQDDFYICVTSRLFNYFTDSKFNPNEIMYKPNAYKTAEGIEILKLSKDLKKHKNVKDLVSAILSSHFYSSSQAEMTRQ